MRNFLLTCLLGGMSLAVTVSAFAGVAQNSNTTMNKTRSIIWADGTDEATDNGLKFSADFMYPTGISYDGRHQMQFKFLRSDAAGVTGNIAWAADATAGADVYFAPDSSMSTVTVGLRVNTDGTSYAALGSEATFDLNEGSWHRVEVEVDSSDNVTVSVDDVALISSQALGTNPGGEYMGFTYDMRVISDASLNVMIDNVAVDDVAVADMASDLCSPADNYGSTWIWVDGYDSSISLETNQSSNAVTGWIQYD